MPSRIPPRSLALFVAVAAALLHGCGGRTDVPPLGKVSGMVTYRGKPLGTGMVVFSPLLESEASTGQLATGVIGKDGSYYLTTFDDGDGALVGEHLVTVKAVETIRTAKPNPKDNEQIRTRGPDGTLSYVFMKSLIPKKFSNPNMTKLRCKVAPGKQEYNIDLVD